MRNINGCAFLLPAWLDPDTAGGVQRPKVQLAHREATMAATPDDHMLRTFIMCNILEQSLFRNAPSVRFPFNGVSRLLVRFLINL